MVQLLQSPCPFVMRHIHTDILGVILHNISEYLFRKVKKRFYNAHKLFMFSRIDTRLFSADKLYYKHY